MYVPARLLAAASAACCLVATLLVVAATPAYAAPGNDAFDAAQPIAGSQGVVYGTLVGATVETGTTCGEPPKSWWGDLSDRSVWYRWAVPTNGTLRFGIKTYGGWTGYVAPYRSAGACGREVQTYPSSSAPGDFGPLDVRRGETIWLGVYSYGPDNIGTFALGWRLIPTPAPLNDSFANAHVVGGQYGTAYGNNINATREAGEPLHAGRAGAHSVWFRWTAPLSGPAMFHLGWPAAPLDCLLAVYTGTAVSALT